MIGLNGFIFRLSNIIPVKTVSPWLINFSSWHFEASASKKSKINQISDINEISYVYITEFEWLNM